MEPAQPLETRLNNFYCQAEKLVNILSRIGVPEDDTYQRSMLREFVRDARESFDALITQGYVAAWEKLDAVSAGFIGLCLHKDRKFPNVNINLSKECADAYLALPEPKGASINLNASLVSEDSVKGMEITYRKRIIGETLALIPQPKDIVPLTQEQFEALQVGTPILIKNKFGGDQRWYTAEVTRGIFPDSIAPAIHFKVTDPDMHIRARLGGFTPDVQFIYYFSDARHIAHQKTE